ncbi:MAG: hypothetical protein KVP17_001074 [Porospora cf. gigantea B]|uniref:uncharacterized protein n=1 Tax=Porospora cf. gigantea B TaxID=2853592 RepID=UPI003571D729|nr:MAG: hypothetical protein KVP17_001074 [Porospora cf. gigantea B]
MRRPGYTLPKIKLRKIVESLEGIERVDVSVPHLAVSAPQRGQDAYVRSLFPQRTIPLCRLYEAQKGGVPGLYLPFQLSSAIDYDEMRKPVDDLFQVGDYFLGNHEMQALAYPQLLDPFSKTKPASLKRAPTIEQKPDVLMEVDPKTSHQTVTLNYQRSPSF